MGVHGIGGHSTAAKVAFRMALAAVAGVAAVIIALAVFLLVVSPGKPTPVLGADGKSMQGTISEKRFVTVNGVEQGMFLRSTSSDNPVLLYLHGGMPDYFLTERYPTGLEKDFTVCWWEQRGAGLSYRAGAPKDTISVDQLVSDTIAVADYLRDRFGKDKIYLMGHSGGTFIATLAAAKAPELFHAYVGIAQVSNQLDSEILAYRYMLDQYRRAGNARMVKRLMMAPVTREGGISKGYLAIRDTAMHRLGVGTMHNMRSVLGGVLLQSFLSRQYTLREKINMWRAKAAGGVSVVWDEMLTTDMNTRVPELRIPVYFFEGVYDYTCSYSGAKSYFERLSAPVKGFYSFAASAHSPLFEEPSRMHEIIENDVLTGRNLLSDPI